MNVTCGQCVCPVPIPTPDIISTDLCKVINSTHSICHISGGLYSWDGAFTIGLFLGMIIIIIFCLIWKLFTDLNKIEVKK